MKIGKLILFEKRVIPNPQDPYLTRWTIFGHPKFLSLCLHKFSRGDHDRALHDHPWFFISLILRGGYLEHHNQTGLPTGQRLTAVRSMDILFRPPHWRHRVELFEDGMVPRPAWTLVLMGPRVRRWGFWLPEGWCWWRKYDTDKGICETEPIHNFGED